MNQRQLIGLGGALVLLLVIAFLAGVFDADFSTVDVPEVAIPTDAVSSIEADGEAIELALERRDDRWIMTRPVEDAADSSTVARFLADLSSMELRNVVSTNPDRYDRYGVDSAATMFTVTWEGGSRTIVVGDRNAGSNYLRIGGDDAVYQTAGSIRAPATVDDWRDKTMIDLPPDRIARVAVVGPSRFTVLERGPEDWRLMDAGEAMQADSAEIRRYLDRFHPMLADGFYESAPSAGDSSYTLRLEPVSGSERRIELTPAGDDYAVRVDGREAVYRLRARRLAQIAPEASQLGGR